MDARPWLLSWPSSPCRPRPTVELPRRIHWLPNPASASGWAASPAPHQPDPAGCLRAHFSFASLSSKPFLPRIHRPPNPAPAGCRGPTPLDPVERVLRRASGGEMVVGGQLLRAVHASARAVHQHGARRSPTPSNSPGGWRHQRKSRGWLQRLGPPNAKTEVFCFEGMQCRIHMFLGVHFVFSFCSPIYASLQYDGCAVRLQFMCVFSSMALQTTDFCMSLLLSAILGSLP